MKMKLSPLWLFLILLIVLIISAIFITPISSLTKESFVSYYGSTASNTSNLAIPNYPNPVDKLYDNDFFDPKNGNILRVFACAYDPSVGQDTTGAGIDYIDVIDRSSNATKFANGETITAGTLQSVPNSYQAWTAYSTDDAYKNITSNQLIYVAWGQDTYLHVLDLNNKLNACGFLYSSSGGAPIYTNINTSLVNLESSINDTNIQNNSYVFDNVSNMVVYQLTSKIAYIPTTGDLRIIDTNGKNQIYNRSGQSVTEFSASGAIQSSTTPWVQYDLVGKNMVIYAPNKTNTIIIVLAPNTDGITYSIVSVSRFLSDGSLQKDASSIMPVPTNLGSGPGIGIGGDTGGLYGGLISAFNRNFSPSEQANLTDNFMRTVKTALGSSLSPAGYNEAKGIDMNDYILKTQIIPPVCPQCPTAVGICTTCGKPAPVPAPVPAPAPSRSRSPTRSGSPSRFYDGLKEAGSETSDLLKSTGSGTANLLRSTGSGTKHLLEEAGSGGKQILEETASGIVGLGKTAVGETVKLGKQAVGGTVDILKDVTSSTVDLARSAGGEVKEILTGEEDRKYYNQRGMYGRDGSINTGYYGKGTQGLQGSQDVWNYNGALPNRGSSVFIPITADFSAFKK